MMKQTITGRTSIFLSVLLLAFTFLSASSVNAATDNEILDMVLPVLSVVSAPPPAAKPQSNRRLQDKTCYCNGFPTGMCSDDSNCVGRCPRGELGTCR